MSISELSEEDISFPDEEDEGPNIGVSHKYRYYYIDLNFPSCRNTLEAEIRWDNDMDEVGPYCRMGISMMVTIARDADMA